MYSSKKPYYDGADTTGIQIGIVVDNYDIGIKKYIINENKVIKYHTNINEATLDGIYIYTNTKSVFMDAGDKFYNNHSLYKSQLEKIFGKDEIPQQLLELNHDCINGKYIKLQDVIEYLEEDFSDWVKENCDFREVTQEDIDEDISYSDFEVGDETLTDYGLELFEKKKLEYQAKLEIIGFTYDFQGGLIWD